MMMPIQRRPIVAAWVLAVCAGGWVVGCAPAGPNGRSQPVQSQRQSPTANRTPQRNDFERSTDAPINADTHFAAAQLSEAQGADDRAEVQYRKALELNPAHQGSLFRMGVLCTKQKRFGDAIVFWNRYTQATGGTPTAYANLGFCLEIAGRTDQAEAAYLKGIKKDPRNAPCRVNYGLLLARHDRVNEAVLEMQTVLNESEVRYNLASVYEGLGRREQAKIEYRKALAADPQMNEAQARLDALE